MDTQKIIETIQNIFIGADERNWELCRSSFANMVHLDYTSLAGGSPADISANEIIESWKSFLPKFKATHHQLGNFSIKRSDASTHVFFYGTATHYFPNESGRNIWTVVGTYDASLVLENQRWKVNYLKMNLKYVDGNLDLPRLIMGG